MSKYIEPPKKPEVSAMSKITDAAKNTGASLVKAVEDACQAAYDSTVESINNMADEAVKAATGAYSTLKAIANNAVDAAGDLYNQANQTAKNFADSVEEAYDDLMADSDAYTGSEYQGTVLNKAYEFIDNLSPKKLKEMLDDPTKIIEMSKDLASAGQQDLKSKLSS